MEEEKCERSKTPLKPHFVLIHGLCGGGWSWFKIKCLLENCSGYKATCLDLRGCGTDPTDGNTIRTFDEYNEPLDEFMAALPEDEKVVLVGYSAGGLSVTKALHKYPNKIQLVIYIAATMLKFGFQTPQDLKIGVPDFSEHGFTGEQQVEEPKQPPTTAHFKLEDAPNLLNQFCSLEDSVEATCKAESIQSPTDILRADGVGIRVVREDSEGLHKDDAGQRAKAGAARSHDTTVAAGGGVRD